MSGRPPHVRLQSAGPRADDERAFAYALGAPYHVNHDLLADALLVPDGAELTRQRERASKLLKDFWDIADRGALVAQLDRLGRDGHREHHRALLRRFLTLRRPAIASLREELREQMAKDADARSELWRVDAVQADRGGIRGADFLAFDTARAVMLAREGMILGWLTEQAGWDYMLDTAREARTTFASWQDYAADYIRGRDFWRGGDQPDQFSAIVAMLLKDRRSPWRRLTWPNPALTLPRLPRPLVPGAPNWLLEPAA